MVNGCVKIALFSSPWLDFKTTATSAYSPIITTHVAESMIKKNKNSGKFA
jgi:hypothetical protein